jgi:putative RNA 2'-phosphotransferase
VTRKKDPENLLKLMTYVLERHPDEFGLVPDDDGFIRMKDLIKAIMEEEGWGFVRQSHINEVLITFRDHSFFVEEDRIRAMNAQESAVRVAGVTPPKLLYHCVRRTAYPVVYERGIGPMGPHHVFLATTDALALRIGKRRDPKPVLLTVQALRASQQGVAFSRQGEAIYLVDNVPVGLFSGPPLPKEKEERKRKEPSIHVTPEFEPGGFLLDMERSEELHRQKIKEKGLRKDIAWKRQARRQRRKR